MPLRVLAADANPSLSAACHRADQSFQVPACSHPDFINQLLKICAAEKVTLLIPTIDPELDPLSASISLFTDLGTRVCISSPETIALARNKLHTHQFLSDLGLPTPRTAPLEDFLRSSDSWRFPIVVKPLVGSSSIGLHTFNSLHEVQSAQLPIDAYLAQEQWAGEEYTVNLFFDSLGLRCAIPHLRWEIRSGEVSKGITRRVPILMQIAERLGEALQGKAFGPLCFQAILTPTGNAAIFELNARFGGGYPLAHEAGANFAQWLLEIASGLSCSAHHAWKEHFLMLRYDAAEFLDLSSAPGLSPIFNLHIP